MSYTLTQYQTTPGISRDYVSTFELGSFSANNIAMHYIFNTGNGYWIPTRMLLLFQFQP
jgi:hypothetical protein